MKRILSLLLAVLLLCSALPVSAAEAPALAVGTVTAQKGQSISVPLTISGNTGICGARLAVSYDRKLTLTKVDSGSAFSSLSLTKPGDLSANPVYLVWDGMEADFSNGVIATLTFTAPQESGRFPISLSYEEGDFTDGDLQEVSPKVESGAVIIPNVVSTVTLSGFVTTPVKNLPDSSAVTGEGVIASVTWSPALVEGKFARNTAYTATLTVAPAEGTSFAEKVTITPFDNFSAFTKNSDGTYKATKTFPKTSDKDAPTAEVPTGLTAVFGDALNSVPLVNPAGNTPGTWSWKEGPGTLVGPAGTQSHIAVFTPNDSENYAVVEKPVSIAVAKRPVTPPVVSSSAIPYDGQEKTIPWQTAPVPQYVVIEGQATGTNAGEYQAVARLKDPNNTEWVGEGTAIDKPLSWRIEAKALSEYTVEVSPASYDYTGEAVIPRTVKVKDGSTVVDPREYILSYENNVQAGNATVIVRDAPEGNYVLSEKRESFEISKIPGTIEILVSSLTFVYDGEPITCGPMGEGSFDFSYRYSGDGVASVTWYSADGISTLPEGAPVNAGKYQAGIAVSEGTNHHAIPEKMIPFTIKPRPIPPEVIAAVSGYSGTYDGTAHDAVEAGNEAADYTLRYSLTENGSYSDVCPTVTNVSDNTTVWVEINRENYESCRISVVTGITRAQLVPIPTVQINGWKYGEAVENPVVTGNTGGGAVTYYYYADSACTQGETTVCPDKVGEYWVKAKIAESENYNAAETEAVSFRIAKGDPLSLPEQVIAQKYTVSTESRKELSRIMPGDAGALTYTKGLESVTGGVAVSAWDITANGILHFTLSGGAVGDTVIFPVTIGSESYEDSTVQVKVVLTEKDVPLVRGKDITVTYSGTPVGAEKITGTAEHNGREIPGSWSFEGSYDLINANRGIAVMVKFTPENTAEFSEQTDTITLTIKKAVPVGTPAYNRITVPGKTLADAALAAGTITPSGGTIRWDATLETVVLPNTAYSWSYEPKSSDAGNYEKLTGTLTPYVISINPGPSNPITPEIIIENGTGGQVELSGRGSALIIPDKGHQIKEILINGKRVEIPVDGLLTGLTSEDTIRIIFEVIFTDVSFGSWYEESVWYAYEQGLMVGKGQRKFDPNGRLTRGELVQILYNKEGRPQELYDNLFVDVKNGIWYEKAVSWAAAQKVVSGDGNGKFRPNGSITRQEVAVMLYQYSDCPEAVGSLDSFSDCGKVSRWAEKAMSWCVESGILHGKGNGILDPLGKATRAEIAVMLATYCKK